MSSARPDAVPPSFDRKTYAKRVLDQIKTVEPEKQVAIAVRAAWRATPRLFAGWQDIRGIDGWWAEHGEAITSKLAMATLYEQFFSQLLDSAAARKCSSQKVGFPVGYVIEAGVACEAAIDNSAAAPVLVRSRAIAEACSFAIAFAISAYPPEASRYLIAEVDIDIKEANAGIELLTQTPLWKAASGSLFLEHWLQTVKEVASIVSDVGVLFDWLTALVNGEDPLKAIRDWFNEWWLNQSENKDRTSVFKGGEAPTKAVTKTNKAPAKKAFPLPPIEQPDPPPPIIKKIYKAPDYSVALASDGVAEKLTDTAEKCKEALRAFLACPDTQAPITVSVEAPWGAGKTSFLHCLRCALEKQNHIPTVWFNPWKHEAGKTLWAAFAVAYERQMAEKLSWLGRWRRRAMLSWQRLSGGEQMLLLLRLLLWGLGFLGLWWLFTHGVSFAGDANLNILLNQHLPVLGTPLLLWGLVKDLVGSFGSPLKVDMVSVFTRDQHKESVDDLHRFHEDFARLMRAYTPGTGPLERFLTDLRSQTDPNWPEQWRYLLRALLMTACRWVRRMCYTHLVSAPEHLDEPQGPRWLTNRVVVFIDDLDRCEAPKAADVLQSLHLMLSSSGQERRENEPDPPGVICILGMDREKVAAAVAAKHEKLLPLLLPPDADGKMARQKALGFGHEFLEKFVQITLHLPGLTGADQEQFLQMITGWDGEKPTEDEEGPPNIDDSQPPEPTPKNAPIISPADADRSAKPASKSKAGATQRAAEAKRVKEAVKEVETHLNDGHAAFICASYVAEALENNPRRLKQFVNLFRLRLYLAAAMNLLDIATLDPTEKRRQRSEMLSAHDIAKLVALDLCCPQTMAEARDEPSVVIDVLIKRAQEEHADPRLSAISRMVRFRPEGAPADDTAFDLGAAPLEKYFQQLASVALPAESPRPKA